MPVSGIHRIVKIIQSGCTWRSCNLRNMKNYTEWNKERKRQWKLKIMIFLPKHFSQKILSWWKTHLSGLRFAKMHSCKIANISTQHGLSNLLFQVTDSYQKCESPFVSLFILSLQRFFCLKGSEIFRWKFWHLFLYHKSEVLLRFFFPAFTNFVYVYNSTVLATFDFLLLSEIVCWP